MPEKSALITALLIGGRMCVDCIGVKADLNNPAVEAYLAVMARVLRVHRLEDVCDACARATTVVSMERPL
jgi:hypothetical protein